MTIIVSVLTPQGLAVSSDSRRIAVIHRRDPGVAPDLRCEQVASEAFIRAHRGSPYVLSDTAQKLFVIRDRFLVATAGSDPEGQTTVTVMDSFAHSPRSNQRSIATFSEMFLRHLHELDYVPKMLCLVAGAEQRRVVQWKVDVQRGESGPVDASAGEYCFAIGEKDVVERLLKHAPPPGVDFRRLSLQDAVDFSRHLVHTSIEQMRFELRHPQIGGAIQTGVVSADWARLLTPPTVVAQVCGPPHVAARG